MNKYNSPNWVCPVCKSVVTLTEKDEAPHYCYKCPSCGAITGADEWTEAACTYCRHYHPVDENNGECPLHGFVGDFCVACADFQSEEDCERLNAEWIEHRGAYRLYYPSRPEDTVAYVDDLAEVDAHNYDVLVAEVLFDMNGPSGNIYYILGMAQRVMKKQRRYTDFNTMRDRVFESKSYEDALAIIGEYVNLVDTTKNAAES